MVAVFPFTAARAGGNNGTGIVGVSPNVRLMPLGAYTTEDDVISSPAIAGGYVYFGSYDNNIYCIDAEEGDLVFTGKKSPVQSGG